MPGDLSVHCGLSMQPTGPLLAHSRCSHEFKSGQVKSSHSQDKRKTPIANDYIFSLGRNRGEQGNVTDSINKHLEFKEDKSIGSERGQSAGRHFIHLLMPRAWDIAGVGD